MDVPVACTLSAAEREDREAVIRLLLAGAEHSELLPRGLALRFDGRASWLGRIAELASVERTCCRFLRFEVAAEPDEGPIHLRITGPEGTREFLEGWMVDQ